MIDPSRLALDSGIYSTVASVYLLIILRVNPRLFLQDYPQEIQNLVAPKTEREKRLSLYVGIPFLLLLLGGPILSTLGLNYRNGGDAGFLPLFVNAFGVAFLFNLADLLVLDWIVFCALTPSFVVLPGTHGNQAYKDYGFHFKGFLVGTLLSMTAGLLIAGIIWLL